MKKPISYQAGLGPLIIIIIVAIVAAGGAGTYQAVKKNQEKKTLETGANVESQAEINSNLAGKLASSSIPTNRGTLRALLAMNRDVVCTVHTDVNGAVSDGTVYVSGSMMRGDFTTKTGATANVDSHMIKNGEMMYMWSGNQGAKISASQESAASGQAQSSVNLDQNVGYDCKNWNKESSKFTAPSTVNFIDLNAMINANGGVQIPGSVKVDASGSVRMGN